MYKTILFIFISFTGIASFSQSSTKTESSLNIVQKLNDSTVIIKVNENSAIYNIRSKKIILSDIIEYYILDYTENSPFQLFVADVRGYIDHNSTEHGENNNYASQHPGLMLYSFDGRRLGDEKINMATTIDPENYNLIYVLPEKDSKNNFMILMNASNHYGLINNQGQVILPFNFYDISFSENEDYFITIKNEKDPEIKYSLEGKLLKN